MIFKPKILLDGRDAAKIVKELLKRRLGYVPEWQPGEKSTDAAIAWIFSRYVQAIIQRLNQAPEKNKLAFLDLLGLQLVPAQSARAPIVLQLSEKAPDSRVPANTPVAAPPPPEKTDQIVFETERAIGVAAAKLKQVFSLWPGRDQYIDHSEDFLKGKRFELFKKSQLQDIPHVIYIAHDTLLALSGETHLDVEFELTTPSSEHLDILWEYWDGKVWRGFKDMRPSCGDDARKLDSTDGLKYSGFYRLETDCAETAKTKVNGVESYWIRGRLTEPLPPNPAQILPEVESVKLKTTASSGCPICPKERRVTFDVLLTGMDYNKSKDGDVISSVEDGIPVSLHDFRPDPTKIKFGECFVRAARNYFGSGNIIIFQNVNMKFDFSTLGGFADQVQFEFLNGIDTVNNISINDEPIQFQNFNDGSHKIAANVNFTIRTTKINPRLSKGIATLSGPIHTLLIGGSAGFEIDNIVARCSYPKGLIPDKAFANSESLDLTKAFYPLGQNPRPGNAFYFTSKEIFSKPKARVQVFMSIAPTPEQNLNIQPGKNATTTKTPLSHSIVWEYWNGKDWNIIPLIPKGMQTSKPDFENGGLFEFEVPEDMAVLKVNDQEAKWMRARLESGGYGFTAKVTWLSSTFGSSLATGPAATTNEFTYVVNQPPALADFRLCYTWQYGPVYPDHVLTYNDFQYEDHTYEARWPGSTFSPFKIVKDVTPELYLGFDKKLPVDRLGLYFDIMEKRGETQGPAMLWEYWDGFEWQRLSAEDETQHLRVPGILSFIAAEDSQPLARFGTELHWLRGRLKEDGPPGEPTINGIFPNAVWVSQRRTLNDVPLGISNGLPNQALNFTQIPVLPGERIEVRELIGPRANVEWRILAQEIFKTNPTSIIKELEEMLGREGDQIDIVKDDLRLRRDRNKRVTEAWVHWQGQPHLFFSTPDDRHYVVDRARGKLFFGDGTNGKVPPAGAAVSAKQYRAGGGLVGNVAAQTIKQLMGGVPGIQDVSNPEPAEGGADGETLEAFSLRGPQTIRHRGRAIAPSDYETLAHEASPAVAVARAIPTHNTSGRVIPGWVTLIIIPQSQELRPWPSFGLRQQVRQFIEEHAPADLAASSHIYVTGPDYFPIDVAATIAPIDPAEAGAVEKRARDALEEFLHPLRGGPDKRGWELGRDVFLSDVASVLERVEGVDYVEEVSLMLNGVPQGEQIAVADDRIVVAGEIRLKLKAAEA